MCFFPQTPSREGGGERGCDGGRVDDNTFGVMEGDEGDPGGGGDDDDFGEEEESQESEESEKSVSGGGGGGSSEGGLRLLPPPYFQLFWLFMCPLLLPPRPPSPDDGYEEGDFEEEDFADNQGGNKNSVTFSVFLALNLLKITGTLLAVMTLSRC